MNPDEIDRVLADFRGWLEDLASRERERPEERPPVAHAPGSPGSIDLYTLVAQFTALRHEVNLQTKATRAAVEQTGDALKRLTQPADAIRSLVKALVDITDSLRLALTALEGAITELDWVRELWPSEPPPPPFIERSGFLSRLLRPPDEAYVRDVRDWAESIETCVGRSTEQLRPVFAGIADGYAISLRRAEAALRDAGIEPIECENRPFDAETMEVVEVVTNSQTRPAGIVVEEVRRGYRWNGTVYRCAQVKVAR